MMTNSIFTWLSEHWLLISVIVGILIQIIQKTTKHFSEYNGVKKVGLYLVELLSILVSKDVEGIVKAPLVSKSEPKKMNLSTEEKETD